MTAYVVDVDNATFDTDVIDASRKVPVLVDFWAPWCAPCRALGPILERLAEEYQGRFILAKVNSDENIALATDFAVRSIPNVKAFVDGRMVDEFKGALPEPAIRKFLERLIPTPAELDRRRAAELSAAGDQAGALALLRKAIEQAPEDDRIRVALAEALVGAGQLDDAETLIGQVRPHIDFEQPIEHLRSRIAMQRTSAEGPDESVLVQRVASDPADLEARFALANRYAASRRFEPALAQLIEIVRQRRQFKDDSARKLMLSIFDLARDEADLVARYRRELSSALH